MKAGSGPNLTASVHQRLLNVARGTGRPFQELLQYFAMERFLYRLSCSPYAEDFVLKGALLLSVWQGPASRSTRDIDLAGRLALSPDDMTAVIRTICAQPVPPDGIVFDSVVSGVRIRDADVQGGIRITFAGRLDRAMVKMQIDVGFGDIVTPAPIKLTYPALLSFPAPILTGYPRETVVAEKLEAIVTLGLINSRMKDYFDLWFLSRSFDFEGETLTEAIRRTCAHRRTELPAVPTGLTDAFSEDTAKRQQWQGFLRTSALDTAEQDLRTVLAALRVFLIPMTEALSKGEAFQSTWTAPGPWVASETAHPSMEK